MAVDSSNLIGLYIALPLYFCFLLGAAVWALRSNRRRKAKIEAEGLEEDQLTAHYLGGRTFNGAITAGTMFASFFSGYTVVGVPNEAFRSGWLSLRWITSSAIIGVGYFGTGARLRKASIVRNHQSPTDFISDRFRSQILRYTAVTFQIFPSVLYLTAQCTALRSTVNSIFRLDPNSVAPVLVISACILVFEWMGGLSCVALTDAVQGFTMCLCFIMLPIVIKVNFGGWADLNWETYPRPDFYQTPNSDEQWLFWNFTIVNFCFFTLPHFLQRTYAARNLAALKFGFNVVALGPWLVILPGVFIGTYGVQLLDDAGIESPASPFGAILGVIMDLGGFPYAVACITFTASIAAIMSTADSLLIAISHVLTAEVVYPIWPDASPARVTMFGRIVSFLSISVALAISILGGKNLSDLAAIQFGLSLQLLPVYLVGLFAKQRTDCHPYSLAAGSWIGFITTFAIHFSYMKGYNPEISGPPFNSGVMGCLVNVAIVIMVDVCLRVLSRNGKGSQASGTDDEEFVDNDIGKKEAPKIAFQPKWDVPHVARFGDAAFTPQLLWKCMEGVREPVTEPWFPLLIFLLTLTMTPLVVGNSPPLDAGGSLAYPPGEVGGVPAWAFTIIAYAILATFVIIWAINLLPSAFPEPPAEATDIDPNTLSLTNAEMIRRVSYDAANVSARMRRTSVLKHDSEVKAPSTSILKGVIAEDGFAEEDGGEAAED